MTTDTADLFLARLRHDLHVAAARRRRRRRRLALTGSIVLGVVLLAGGAYAAAQGLWTGRNLTPADIARQATTVTDDTWSQCDGNGHCVTTTGTHAQIQMLPAMGVTFVLPDGKTVTIIPAAGFLPAVPAPYGPLEPTADSSGAWTGGTWRVPLAGGGTRTVTWTRATGAVSVTDTHEGGSETTALHAGDVVPLIPGSLAAEPRTLDKAVTFDLPTGNRVIIFPGLNESYVDDVEATPADEPLGAGVAARYGLIPVGDHNGRVPTSPDGGTWKLTLPNGDERTISWRAGRPDVTISDRSPTGAVDETAVAPGHELPLIPFR